MIKAIAGSKEEEEDIDTRCKQPLLTAALKKLGQRNKQCLARHFSAGSDAPLIVLIDVVWLLQRKQCQEVDKCMAEPRQGFH